MAYLGIEKYIFSDVYNFFLKHKDTPNEDYYWECCLQDAKLIWFKYHNYPLAKKMVLDVLDQLDFKKGHSIEGKTYEEWEKILGDYRKLKPFNPKTYKD